MITDYNGYAGSPSEIEFSEAAPEPTKIDNSDRIVATAYVRGVEHRCVISKICGGVYDEYAGGYGDDDTRFITAYYNGDADAIKRWRHHLKQIWGRIDDA